MQFDLETDLGIVQSEKFDKVKEIMSQLIAETNSMGDQDVVAAAITEAIVNDHRTLQQNFWRVMFSATAQYADAGSDPRNAASVEACGLIKDTLKTTYLPLI